MTGGVPKGISSFPPPLREIRGAGSTAARCRPPTEDGGPVAHAEAPRMSEQASEGKRRRAHRRGNGEGTIYQRKSDGLWIGQAIVSWKADGRPDRRTLVARTRGEVQRKLADLRGRADKGLLAEPAHNRETVGDFLVQWLEASRATIRPRTWEHYERIVRLHVPPSLGRLRLDALRPNHLQHLYAVKLQEGLSPKMVSHIHGALHRALGLAVKWGYLPRNVADATEAPRVPVKELRIPGYEELVRLLDVARAAGDPMWQLWTVAAYSGCRQAELLGLKWEDVDIEASAITIQRILVRARNCAPVYGEPKTAKSRRVIALPGEAMAALRSVRARQIEARRGQEWHDFDLVFTSRFGTPLIRRNVNRSLSHALARADLPSMRFHDLRHAHATLMLQAGVPMKVASDRLGHSTIAITMNLYTHRVQQMDVDAAERVEELMRRRPCKSTALQT